MESALIYARVSTKEQSESLPVQEAKCRNFSQSLNLNVVLVFTDAGASARTADRPQLQALLAYCKKHKNKIKHVIVADLSRLARNVADQGTIIATLAEYGVRLRSVDESSLQDDATGKLGKNIIGAFSQFFSDSLSERTKYKGFELMGTGNYTADDVLRSVTALGFRTARGLNVSRQTWHAILRNPLYAGWVRSGDITVRGVHPTIVSQELFDAVQEVLAGRSKTAGQTRQVLNPEFPLRQIVRCAKCGKGLTGGIAKKRFRYYWCYQRDCRAVLVPAQELEDAFVGWIAQYEPTVEYLALLPELAKDVWEKRQDRAQQDIRTLNSRLQEQRHLNSQAIKAKLKGELLEEDFQALKLSITEETALIQQQITALESERSTMEELIAQTQRELIDLPAAWNKAGFSERRELFAMLFPQGLAWSHSMGFLNSKNTSIMQDLADDLNDDEHFVNIGVPDGI